MLVILEERPACFADQAAWQLYLDGVRNEAMSDPALRRTMERGRMPRYCAQCAEAHRTAMESAGRCNPLKEFRREHA